MVTGLQDRLCIAVASALLLSVGCNIIDEGVTPAQPDAGEELDAEPTPDAETPDADRPEPDASDDASTPDPDASPDPDVEPDTGPDCDNLECLLPECTDQTTSLIGQVTLPSGSVGVPGVDVYVPNAPLDPVPEGAVCETCPGLTGQPLIHTTTGLDGIFRLEDLPAGEEIPLVISIGRWRREHLLSLDPCADHELDPDLGRLPRNSDEGHIPKMAVVTSQWDTLECMLRSMGIDDQEFGGADSSARIHLFQGRTGATEFTQDHGGEGILLAPEWWTDADNLSPYDLLLYGCEGNQHPEDKGEEAQAAFWEYVESGGRVLLNHWQNYWIQDPELSEELEADWTSSGVPNPSPGVVNTDFEAGEALFDWLVSMDLLDTAGRFPIFDARSTLGSIGEELTNIWVTVTTGPHVRPASIDFATPVNTPAEEQCGWVIFGDLHASPDNQSSGAVPFPDRCSVDELSTQELVLLFQLFELTRCEPH